MANKINLISKIEKFNRVIDDHFLEVKKDAAQSWKEGILDLMEEPKSGRKYKRPGKGKGRYTASAPGEAPAIRTGDLYESYEVRASRKSNRVMIGTPLKYGFFLERGTRKFKPRPHIKPAFTARRDEIADKLGRPIRDTDFAFPRTSRRRRRRR